MRFMKKIIGYTVFFLCLIILRIFLFEIYSVSQSSMKNTYQRGDRVLIIKNFYSIKQNDILVFRHDNENAIKRCVCLPGDTLRILKGSVYSNNVVLNNPKKAIIENAANDDVIARSNIYFAYGTNWTLNNFGPYIVPKKGMKVSLTPDNVLIYGQIIRKDSLKSDAMVSKRESSGNFYTFQNDYVFLVGDNRMLSRDSRVFGPIAVSDIKGKVILKF